MRCSKAWGRIMSSVEWYTPAKYIEAARRVLGGIVFDPASCAEANETVDATVYCTQATKEGESDGLSAPWLDRWWCNPPYGPRHNDVWAARAIAECDSGHNGIYLHNATTDRKWFHALADEGYAYCLTDHRIGFIEPGGDVGGAPRFGSVFFLCSHDRAMRSRFCAKFAQFGHVGRGIQSATVRTSPVLTPPPAPPSCEGDHFATAFARGLGA